MSSQTVRSGDAEYLSYARCRELARESMSGDQATEAARVFRPYTGPTSPFRSRAPMALSLYVADRDGLLVHHPDLGFVVLRPPERVRRPSWADGLGRGVLRVIDRHWNGVALLGPAAALLVIAAVLVLTTVRLGPVPAVLWAGLVAGLAALAWVVVAEGLGLVMALVRAVRPGRSGLDRFAAQSLPETAWTAALTHLRSTDRARDLVSLTVTTVHRYVQVTSRERAGDVDGLVRKVDSGATLMFLRRAVTTRAGRDSIAASLDEQLFGPTAEVFLVDSPDRGANQVPSVPSASFFFLFAGGVAAVLAFCALIVAQAERTACGSGACAGRPATYPDAVRFLAQRLWFSDPSDLAPATAEGFGYGWLFSLLGLTGVGVAVVSVILVWRRRATLQSQLADRRRGMTPLPELVIVTALPAEHQAVVEHLSDLRERQINGSIFEVGTYFGRHYVWTVAVVQVGSTGEKAAVQVERACTAFQSSLSHLMFVGVAGGRKDVAHGDVVMADSVYDYQAGKDEADGFRPRFKTHHSSHELVQRAQAVARRSQWQQNIRPTVPPPPLPRAFVKPMAAGSRVIASDRSEAARLIAQNCGDAVAVETVSFDFLYAAHVNPTVSAAVVCGVSDLLSDKTEARDARWQPVAARHAAAFAFTMIADTRLA